MVDLKTIIAVAAMAIIVRWKVMSLGELYFDAEISVGARQLHVWRVAGGAVAAVEPLATDQCDLDFARGMGFVHAKDRLVQMLMQRTVVQGRLSELFKDDPELRVVDEVFRRGGVYLLAQDIARGLTGDVLDQFTRYSEAVNEYIADSGDLPGELRLLGITMEPWTVADCVSTLLLMASDLGGKQGETERLVMQSIHDARNDSSEVKRRVRMLKDLFSPTRVFDSPETVELLQRDDFHFIGFTPSSISMAAIVPSMRASNNWAVHASLSASGGALQANDPHLAINRLPGVWTEMAFRCGPERSAFGITIPGAPSLVMGRTQHVSWGLTYGFADQIDYFFEEVRDGRVRRDNASSSPTSSDWVKLTVRDELLARKSGAEPVKLRVFASDRGILEIPGTQYTNGLPKDGLYLAKSWAFDKLKGDSLEGLVGVPSWRTVEQARSALARSPISSNYIMADSHGSIGYQQAALAPRRSVNQVVRDAIGERRRDGFSPLPAWDPSTQWDGFIDGPTELLSVMNPASGVLVTANDALEEMRRLDPGKESVVNVDMGSHRVDRGRALLLEKAHDGHKLTVQDMQDIQIDVFAREANATLALLTPILTLANSTQMGGSVCARELLAWDRCYEADSTGALIYEFIIERLLDTLFAPLLGTEGAHFLQRDSLLMYVVRARMVDLVFGLSPIGKVSHKITRK